MGFRNTVRGIRPGSVTFEDLAPDAMRSAAAGRRVVLSQIANALQFFSGQPGELDPGGASATDDYAVRFASPRFADPALVPLPVATLIMRAAAGVGGQSQAILTGALVWLYTREFRLQDAASGADLIHLSGSTVTLGGGMQDAVDDRVRAIGDGRYAPKP